MDIQLIYGELVDAIESSLDYVFSKYLPNESESAMNRLSMISVLKSIKLDVLSSFACSAKVELEEAQIDYENECQCITFTEWPRPSLPLPSLPLEIVQYIISLAYNNERTQSEEQPTTGARSLLFEAENQTSNHLFASTTLDIHVSAQSSRKEMNTFLERTSPAGIHLSVVPSPSNDWIPDALRHVSRWKTLEIHGPHDFIAEQLAMCKDALFYTQSLTIIDEDRIVNAHDNLNENLIETLQHSDAPNLQSSTISMRYLTGLVSSGLLANVIDLEVIVGSGDDAAPLFKQYITPISQLKKLISLSLNCTDHNTDNIDYDTKGFFSGADSYLHPVISLKSLQVKTLTWGYAKQLIPWFSACDLNRFSIAVVQHFFSEGYHDVSSDRDAVFSSLSSIFPHLQQLSISSPRVRAYKLLAAPQINEGEACKFANMHSFEYARNWFTEDKYDLIKALRSRTTPEAHSAGIVPINRLTLTRDPYSRDEKFVMLKYELGQVVPNLIILEP